MNMTKLIGIILIAGGCLGLAYGGFSYTKETTGLKVGPPELKVEEKHRVNVPLIVSAAAIVLGVFLLVVARQSGPSGPWRGSASASPPRPCSRPLP